MQREIERLAKEFREGAESRVCFQITGDRYSAGSTAVGVALLLFAAGGVELVEKFFEALNYCEDSQ